MLKKTFTAKQIIRKLREAEVLLSQGQTVPVACKVIGVAEPTGYRWRKSYGGLKIDRARLCAPLCPIIQAMFRPVGYNNWN